MSKPILSELEYNADNVASAILSQADLSVTNEDLGVTERTSDFIAQSGWTTSQMYIFSFNGFMFFSGSFVHADSVPADGEAFVINSNIDTRPSVAFHLSGGGYQGDTVNFVSINTDGEVTVDSPTGTGASSYYLSVNGWYRF